MTTLGKAQVEGQRLQSAIDAEYRGARRENTWGRTQPQIVERWRIALRAWLTATEADATNTSSAQASAKASTFSTAGQLRVAAVNTIWHDATHASRVILPTMK